MLDTYSPLTLAVFGSLVVQTGSYVVCSLPSLVFQLLPFMDKYRIQSVSKKPTAADHLECLKLVFFSHFGIFYPLAFALYYVFGLGDLPMAWETMPRWHKILGKLVLAMIIEDTWHYFMHRTLHHKSIYGQIHKIHHNFSAPFSFAAEYAHPIETAILGFGFFLPLIFLCDHLMFFWCWLALRTGQACDSHSGYNVWNPLWLLPFYGGKSFVFSGADLL
jgi:methylsterol monooxygenase